jgi:hypothetical protein
VIDHSRRAAALSSGPANLASTRVAEHHRQPVEFIVGQAAAAQDASARLTVCAVVSGLPKRPARAHNGQRVQRVADQVSHDGPWHGASEKDAHVNRLAYSEHVFARHPGADESLAQIVEVRPSEGLGKVRVAPSVGGQVMMLGDDYRELVGPAAASGALQPSWCRWKVPDSPAS